MKITFSNLGAIKRTTLDLRPLTVIIGPNNSNKTYIAYSVYGLWQAMHKRNISRLLTGLKFKKDKKNGVSLKIDEVFYETFISHVNLTGRTFRVGLETFFQDSSHKLFKKTDFNVEISRDDIKNAFTNFLHTYDKMPKLERAEFTFIDEILYIRTNPQDNESNSEMPDQVFSIRLFFAVYMLSFLFPEPFLLPAERNAFIITYKILANKRLKNLRQIERERISARSRREIELLREQGDIRYPQPTEDFLDFLSDVEFEKDINNEEEKKKRFCELADKIEESIQGKNKTNFKPTKFGGKEIKINVTRGLDIDLYNASSSIKQLAPLLLYLRYRAEKGDMLIIDEPEMNLHPESQAKLLEVLGMLVNAGVNVMLTTHSPYFMSHLNNLIAGDMTNESVREKQSKSLYLEDSRAFLKPEDVSAYEMKNNKLVSLKHKDADGDYSISWETLSDVSAEIQRKFFEMYETREETSNSEEKE